MEHDKLEIFHFSRVHNDSNPELDLSAIGAPTLKPKHTGDTWDFILIDVCSSRNMVGTILPRYFQW